MIGKVLDRFCFWNLPEWCRSYQLPVSFESGYAEGIEYWFIPGREDRPTVLFCHGNSGNLRFPQARRDRFLALHRAGVNLWVFDYRGYGKSQGQPSEKGVYQDAEFIHSLARSRHNSAQAFILFGRSLGGAVATYLATEVQCPELLILESTFTSAPAVCAQWSCSKLASFMSYKFPSLQRIPDLACPLQMIHGTRDQIVPYSLGQELFLACPQRREFLCVVGAGHNNLQRVAGDDYQAALERWISEVPAPK